MSASNGSQNVAEVRITAKKLADGRVEFGLQQREADGGWGERLLPRVRKLPANAKVDRWLSSSPVSLTATSQDLATLPITTSRYYILDESYDNLSFSAGRFNDAGRFLTRISIEGSTNIDITAPSFYVTCAEPYFDEQGGLFAGVSFSPTEHQHTNIVFLAERFNIDGWGYPSPDSIAEKLQWEVNAAETPQFTRWDITEERMRNMSGFHRLTVGYYDDTGTLIIGQFDLELAFGTPVQANLDYCGQYEIAESAGGWGGDH